MTITLSIKNVPVELVKRLKRKAAMHKRSLQGELLNHSDRGGFANPSDG